MAFSPKRLLLFGAAPFALAAVYGGSVAFAQSADDTPTPAPTEDAAPQTPTTPETAPEDRTPGTRPDGVAPRDGCPEKGSGSGSGSGSGASPTAPNGETPQTTPDTQTRGRSRSTASSAF